MLIYKYDWVISDFSFSTMSVYAICTQLSTVDTEGINYAFLDHFLKPISLNLSRVTIKKTIVLILHDRPSAWFDCIGQIKDV